MNCFSITKYMERQVYESRPRVGASVSSEKRIALHYGVTSKIVAFSINRKQRDIARQFLTFQKL